MNEPGEADIIISDLRGNGGSARHPIIARDAALRYKFQREFDALNGRESTASGQRGQLWRA
ncbi:hypothetical protein CU102_19600 [Phyllobacterium brassicacearum]|uniref:Uncharacterized protein n=1 Tax=Phyllobacterium brassicacearum TaxID=314235 RepID=A0A2P7BH12_9HYPH|nr:hypothetical protein CU102_19600 [Phyllobacterium brassicacearum]